MFNPFSVINAPKTNFFQKNLVLLFNKDKSITSEPLQPDYLNYLFLQNLIVSSSAHWGTDFRLNIVLGLTVFTY